MNKLASILLGAVLLIVLYFITGRAIDIHIMNQDTMLCESAKVSGNIEYLEKCQCYYQSGEIKCLQKIK